MACFMDITNIQFVVLPNHGVCVVWIFLFASSLVQNLHNKPLILFEFYTFSPLPIGSHPSGVYRDRSFLTVLFAMSTPDISLSPSSLWLPLIEIALSFGGTAFNGVAEELKKVTTRVAHVLPVSDDGGSTAEIVRVVGKDYLIMDLRGF
ncbi:hypothetical protein KSP40_PGU021428 [Platanthera guangdongensis]|uniref:Uncharacterized protein n=1 Tax=Platanthera guangdongensis TaxID=2320717 RepID=A0ABR2M4B5_9ASPA